MTEQIEDIIKSVVDAVGEAVTIIRTKADGTTEEREGVAINYIYGSGTYLKDMLDVRSKSRNPMPLKFPLVALFTPNVVKVDSRNYQYKTTLNMIIACSSKKDWSNEKRMETSFKRILLPIYEGLMSALLDDARFLWEDDFVPHTMSKNFDYGRYGAYDASGGEVSEPIDAIDIRSLEITINNEYCR